MSADELPVAQTIQLLTAFFDLDVLGDLKI